MERLPELAASATCDNRDPGPLRGQPVISGRSGPIAGRALRSPRRPRLPRPSPRPDRAPLIGGRARRHASRLRARTTTADHRARSARRGASQSKTDRAPLIGGRARRHASRLRARTTTADHRARSARRGASQSKTDRAPLIGGRARRHASRLRVRTTTADHRASSAKTCGASPFTHALILELSRPRQLPYTQMFGLPVRIILLDTRAERNEFRQREERISGR